MRVVPPILQVATNPTNKPDDGFAPLRFTAHISQFPLWSRSVMGHYGPVPFFCNSTIRIVVCV